MEIVLPPNDNEQNKKSDQTQTEYIEKKAQADALLEKATTDPVGMIKGSVSISAQNLVETDNDIKQKKEKLAHDVVGNAFEQVNAENIKDTKKTYYELNKNDIDPYGGDKDTSKGQQKVLVYGSKFFWVLVMACIGFFYIMPIKTMLEVFRGLSFRKIEETKTTSGAEITIVERKKLGWIGTLIGIVLSIAWCGGMVLLNIMFPFTFLYIAIGLFAVIGLIVICGGGSIRVGKKRKASQETAKNTENIVDITEDKEIIDNEDNNEKSGNLD